MLNTKNGYATNFTITCTKPLEHLELDMYNGNMSCHCVGVFTEAGNNTEIEFAESVEVKKLIMKPFAKTYLKKQREQYISDLRKAQESKVISHKNPSTVKRSALGFALLIQFCSYYYICISLFLVSLSNFSSA